MGLTMRRPNRPEPAIADAGSVDETWAIPVGVAKVLEHLAEPIAVALRPGLRVERAHRVPERAGRAASAPRP